MTENASGAQVHPDSAVKTDTAAATAAATGKTTDSGAGPPLTPTGTDGKQGAPGTSAEPGKPAGAAAAVPKAPEKYELKVPMGDEVYVDDRVLSRITTIARASGWSNDDAQAALEEFLGNVKAEGQEFLTATKADPDYGGDRLAETQRLAKVVIDKIRPVGHTRRDEFLRLVNRAGAFNHIEVVSFLADLGKLMAEDRPARGTGGAGAGRTPEQVLYGTQAGGS